MLSIADKHKVAAFGLMVKYHFQNAVLSSAIPVTKLCNLMGISYRSFVNYKKLSISAGVLVPTGKHYRFINTNQMYKQLGLIEENTKDFHKTINQFPKENPRFSDFYAISRESIYIHYFKAQKFVINKKAKDYVIAKRILNGYKTHKSDLPVVKRLLKQAKSEGKSFDLYLSSIIKSFNEEVICGSYQLSELFGFSQRTANRILNKISEKGIATRHIMSTLVDLPVSNGSWDYMRRCYPKLNFFPLSNFMGYMVIIGSVMSLSDRFLL